MRINLLSAFFVIFIFGSGLAQNVPSVKSNSFNSGNQPLSSINCITIYPTKDAFVSGFEPNTNWGNHPDFHANRWTISSTWAQVRSVMEFDLSAIPTGATITGATLTLYGYASPHNGGHNCPSSGNASFFRMNTSAWSDSTITWSNKPGLSTTYQISVSPICVSGTNLVLNNQLLDSMIQYWVNNPSQNFGLCMLLQNETGFNLQKLTFGSSNNPNAALRPKIEICYIDFHSTITSDNISCNGYCDGSASVSAAGGVAPYTYLWSTNDTSQTINNLCAGMYTVTVTGADSATVADTVIITEPPILTVVAGSDTTICQGQSVSISADASGGTPPLFYLWSHGLGMGKNKTVSPPVTTAYTVHAVDIEGCYSAPDTIVVTVEPIQQSSIIGLSSSYCANDSNLILNANPVGGIFTGPGVSGNIFSPATAGAGQHTISYSIPLGCVNPSQVQVTVHPVPQLSIGGLDTSYCSNAPTVNLTGTPAGGSFSGNGVSFNSFSPSQAGQGVHAIVYNYTSVNGCSNTSSVTTNVKTAPVASAGSNMSIQPGTSATLMGSASAGSGMYSYMWAPADSFFFANVQAPTTVPLYSSNTFTLTVTDLLTQCQGTDQVIVSVHSSSVTATLTASPSSACHASPVQLNVVPGGGQGNYTYVWASNPPGLSSNIANPVVHPTISTTYTVTVSSGSLSTTAQTAVNVFPYTQASITGLAAQICSNANAVNLQASPAGGSFAGTGVSGGVFHPGIAGTGLHAIIYNYTDSYGCYAGDTAWINVVAATVVSFTGLPLSVCDKDFPYLLSGSPAGGSFIGNGISGNTFDAQLAGTGTHLVSYSYTDQNSCTSEAHQAVLVKPSPQANAGNDQSIACGASSAPLGNIPQAGHTYMWSPTAGLSNPFIANPIATPTHSTAYILTVTDLNTQCSATDTVIVNITGTPVISLMGDTSICPGASVLLMASGAQRYIWSTGDTVGVITVKPEKSKWYTVRAFDFPGCETIDSVFVEVFTPKKVFLGNDTVINLADTITLDAGPDFISYYWSNSSYLQSISFTGYDIGVGNHSFWVMVTDSNYCMSFSDTIQILVTVGIENLEISNHLKVYPNPFDDFLIIESRNNNEPMQLIEIYSIDGRLIYRQELYSQDARINTKEFSKGVYILKVATKNTHSRLKIMR